MSWAVLARRVRDPARPMAQRVSALRSLVNRHAPFGFEGTQEHLRELAGVPRRWRWLSRRRSGPSWTEEQLTAALDGLEESRASHLRFRAAFAERRRLEKAGGRRQPTRGDTEAWSRAEWLKDVDEARRRHPSRREARRPPA